MPSLDTKIGDFSAPLASQMKAKQGSPTKDALDDAERRLDQEAASLEAEVKPMSSYEDKLKEAGLTREEAARIIDSVLTKGYYAEEVSITKAIRARFRTRSARDTRRAQDQIEAVRPAFDASYQELLSRQLLAASLEQFGKDKLPHAERRASQEEVEKAFADRLAYVEALPDLALRLLLQKLISFDRKMSILLEEGVVANF
jgi:hypothetical protein